MAQLAGSRMRHCTHKFTSELQRIVEFLYRAHNLNHQDVVYMNFAPDICVFEDKSSGSYLYLEFSDRRGEKISRIHFSLVGDGSIIHTWLGAFQRDLGATVSEIG